ncbi:hypothetical protein Clacol_010221 [Clathrus columnatus]|uniref:Uncharacterized protein n=1 Tax=Clathrus columnatus TaxID=1419009 RepID=A0AAV5AQA0_9AGAM|nr:hypothetical protein Clacol_010221 [Clathrus columnatus]
MAFETPSRQVIVENNDPRITYVGEWMTVETSSVNDIDQLRFISVPTLQSSLLASVFDDLPYGSSISISGTVNSTLDIQMTPMPFWRCFVDGLSSGGGSISESDIGPGDWMFFCFNLGLADGPHELVVNITSNGITPFYIEYLVYTPSVNASLEDSLIVINPSDPAIDYPVGWTAITEGQAETSFPNGLLNVTFIGTQISWYGGGVQQRNAIASSGEYSIDGGQFMSFQIPTADEALGEFQLYFITSSLEMGTHVLSVRYTGLEGQLPLVLEYLVVSNGSFSSTSTTSPTMIPSGDGNKAETSRVGATVGEIVGPIVGFAIVIAILFACFRYRRKQGRPSPGSNTQDRHLTLPETSEISQDRTHLVPPNVSSDDIVSVLPSDSESVNTNPFHTPIHTPFRTDPSAGPTEHV